MSWVRYQHHSLKLNFFKEILISLSIYKVYVLPVIRALCTVSSSLFAIDTNHKIHALRNIYKSVDLPQTRSFNIVSIDASKDKSLYIKIKCLHVVVILIYKHNFAKRNLLLFIQGNTCDVVLDGCCHVWCNLQIASSIYCETAETTWI